MEPGGSTPFVFVKAAPIFDTAALAASETRGRSTGVAEVSGRRIAVFSPGLDFDPRSEPSAVGDDPHIAKVTFTTAAEDGVGYQGGGRAFRGGRGRGNSPGPPNGRPVVSASPPKRLHNQGTREWPPHREPSRRA